MDSCDRWYAVQTKPRCEDQAVAWLQRRTNSELFLPRLETMRRRRGRKIRCVEPLFPSYLFVRMPLDLRQWHVVKWTPGVKDLVTLGNIPVPVPDEAIELLKARSSRGFIPWEPRSRPGARVRIISGPLSGLVGLLERSASHGERVRVLLNLMHTAASVEVDVVDLEEVAL